MWLLSAGDCSPLTRRAAGMAVRICLLMSCTVRISRWIRASAPKMPRLRGMPWTCCRATLGGNQRHRRPVVKLLERGNVDGGSAAVFRGVLGRRTLAEARLPAAGASKWAPSSAAGDE